MYRVTILLLFLLPQGLHACSLAAGWFQPNFDQVSEDSYLVPEFRFSVKDIKRGVAPRPTKDKSIFVSGSCDDLGRVNIIVESENGFDPCNYGFYVYGSKGQVPVGLIPRYPKQPIRLNDQCILSLSWIDGATSSQEAIMFKKAIAQKT